MSAAKDIEAQAADWLARLQRSELTEKERASLEAWRAASALHEAAFVRLEAVSRRLDRLAALCPAGNVPDPDLLLPKPVHRPARWPSWAAAAVLAVLAVGIVWWQFATTSDYEKIFATERGGFERALLPDGSVMHLNTASRVHVRYSAERRLIELRAGEATFEVAKDAARPFLVNAGGVTVRAVGTAFTVRVHSDATRVLVTEGEVTVTSQPQVASTVAPQAGAVSVAAGQKAIADRESIKTLVVSDQELTRELAWHSGMLSFDNDTLGDIAAEFNRYNLRQITIADPDLAAHRMGGYFRATNLDAFVYVLEQQFGIRAVEQSGGAIRLERAPHK